MKTAVETIFVRESQYNRRFVQSARIVSSNRSLAHQQGWEKGQVENQVVMRERFFTPRLRFKCYDELNAWLMDKCIAWGKAHGHPERPNQTIWEVFEEEQPKLIPYRGRLDGFHALPGLGLEDLPGPLTRRAPALSPRPVEIHAYAQRVVMPGRAHPGGSPFDAG